MKSYEPFVTSDSDYYVYSPSQAARDMMFYPLYVGCFTYEPGYTLHRDSYDSYLLLYIRSGSMCFELDGHTIPANPGSFVLIDCYRPHSYHTLGGCKCLWCHFDGPTAAKWYAAIVARLGNVFYQTDPYPAVNRLESIYDVFRLGKAVKEPLISQSINDILTNFLLYCSVKGASTEDANPAEQAISYINEHFAEDIPVTALAAHSGLSQYHFIRIFKKETGFTPHGYLIKTRINTAKYLLKNSDFSIKDICYKSGFSNESVFCSVFKKHLGMTPTEYRSSNSAAEL